MCIRESHQKPARRVAVYPQIRRQQKEQLTFRTGNYDPEIPQLATGKAATHLTPVLNEVLGEARIENTTI